METISLQNHFNHPSHHKILHKIEKSSSFENLPSANKENLLSNRNTPEQDPNKPKKSKYANLHLEKAEKDPTQECHSAEMPHKVSLTDVTNVPSNFNVQASHYKYCDSVEREYFMRCVMIGAQSSGKHSLIHSFFGESSDGGLMERNGADFLIRKAEILKTTKIYHFWVRTLGKECQIKDVVWKTYYRWAAAFIFVYDITDKNSFLALEKTIQQINELVPQNKFFGILVGNKADLHSKREVEFLDGLNFKKKYGLNHFIETDFASEKEHPRVLANLDSKLKLTFEAL